MNNIEYADQNKKDDPAIPVPLFTSLYTMLLFRAGTIILFLYLLKSGNVFPAFFLLVLIFLIETAGLWSKLGLKKLQAETNPKLCRLFPDDEIVFSVVFKNKKRLPAILHWSQPLPADFYLSAQDSGDLRDTGGDVFLGSHATKTDEYRLKAQKRGYYKTPALHVYSRDMLGLFYRHKTLMSENRIIVYPRLFPYEELGLKAANFSGLDSDKRPFLFDPIMFAGLRDYTPDMPARLIHWKATAHQDRLLAKIIEPSASLKIMIAIHAQTFTQPALDEALWEKALSIAATIAVWADSNKIPFGIAANMRQKEQAGSIFLPVNRNLDQGKLVLESLARAELVVQGNLEDILNQISAGISWSTTLILIEKGQNTLPLSFRFRQVVSYPLTEDAK